MSRALVIGSEGQDGRILSERLRAEGCEIVGIGRGTDLLGREAMLGLIADNRPDEIYYLAAVHHSAEERASVGGRDLYVESHRVHVEGVLNVLEAVRLRHPGARLFYAASCLVFGEPATSIQDESTPLAPVCVYGITKTTGIHCCRLYRGGAGVHASSGILYNHESPLRRPEFASQKIVRGALDIRQGRASTLVLGDLSAVNDWGWAEDTVDAMIRIVRSDRPDDFVVATGAGHTVADFVEAVFARAGLDWKRHVKEDRSMIARKRPPLIGDASRLRQRTGWRPSVAFEEMAGRLWDAAWAAAAGRRP
jgi:GDPmannose 4,6-dehydratase